MANSIVVLGAGLAQADCSVLAGKINMTGAPSIDTKLVGLQTLGVERYVIGMGQSVRLDFTVANNTYYAFNVISNLPSNGRFGAITVGGSYTSDAVATATEIRDGLKNSFLGAAAALGVNLTVTDPGGANTYITINGGFATSTLRDFSAYQLNLLSNLTLATGVNDAMYIAPNGTPGTALGPAAAGPVTITTLAAHGLVPGNIVYIKDWATVVLSFKGATPSAATGIVTRVLSVSGLTFVLEGVTKDPAVNTGTIQIFKVASQPMGTPAAVQSEINSLYLPDGPVTAPVVDTQYNYSRVKISGYQANPGLPGVMIQIDYTVYYAAALVANPYTVTTTAATTTSFETNLISFLNGLNAGALTANPSLIEASSGTIL